MERNPLNLRRKRLKWWLARLAAVLVSAGVALISAEMLLRYIDPLPETDQSNATIVYAEREDFFNLKPHLRGVPFTGIPISSNEFGYRCRNMRLEKGPATFRVALLGDSWGFGWGLEEEETIAHRLEALLRYRYPGAELELFNFSIPSYNLADYYRVLKHDVMRFRPDYCVVLLHLNDIEIPLQRATRQEVEAWKRRPMSLWRQPLRYIESLELYKLTYAKVLLPLAIYWELPNEGFVDVFRRKYGDGSETLPRYREYAEKIGELLRVENLEASLFLLPLPLARRNPYQLQPINDKVRAIFQTQGIAVEEVLSSYKQHPKHALVISAVDGHPNAFAAELLAREIFSLLSRQPGFHDEL